MIKRSVLLLVALIIGVNVIGCSARQRTDTLPLLLESLRSRDRHDVHLALVALKANDIVIPEGIDLERPYSESQTHLDELITGLSGLDPTKMNQLEKSLVYHRSVYSPKWLDSKWK